MKKYKLSKKVIKRLEDLITMDFLSLEDNVKNKKDINLTEKYIKFCFNHNRIPNKVYNLDNLTSEKLGYYLPRYYTLNKVSDYINREFGKHLGLKKNKLDEYVEDCKNVDEIFIKTLSITLLKIFNSITSYGNIESMCQVFLGNLEVILLKDYSLVNSETIFNTRYCGEKDGTIGIYLEVMDNVHTIDFKNMCKYMIDNKEKLLHLSSYLYGLKESNSYYGKEDVVVNIFKDIIIDAFKTINTILINKEKMCFGVCGECTEVFILDTNEISNPNMKKDTSSICTECLKATIK